MELRHWLTDHGHIIRKFPKLDEDEELIEGKETNIRANRFERSAEARKKCIAHYGTACQICGFDFGKAYGPDFAGRIEVHHIIPLSEIREDYVVDPITDLIPVCSNCHTALHSKKDGVYSPKELKSLLASSGE
ncbi:MAG: HNH endonuclease [Clostridia bacterium]|nr:HNH endonuclease [Clostridia bacterium]